jgi:hypothetical protein
MKEDLYQMSRVSKTGMGEPPAGVKAFVALQFMHDAENRGQNETVMNFNKVVRDIHFFNVAIAGEMYKKEDKRTIQVLGQKGQYTNMDFDPETLAKPFSVVIQNTSALPETKGAKFQFVLDMSERFPDLFSREEIIEILDMGLTDKFMGDSANSVATASSENEDLLTGKGTTEPEEYENHIIHWRIHDRSMQDPSFKQAPEEIKKAFIDHMKATEMLMHEKAMQNPRFAESLAAIPMFPKVFVPPQPEAAPEMSAAMPPQPPQAAPEMSAAMPPEQLPPDAMEQELQPLEPEGAPIEI